ncbi:YfjI family protein [Pusillimonas sp. ANT_WB101]|uniref:YfjI family protein n=1 Tax=Pusillimonas sp. ANT_WB101 TaxID=2597356 RepID=UPI00165E038D|nr:YfjI family protein [Pusillimonas sp. ANT_WB101]
MSITELERATAAIDGSMPGLWMPSQWPDPLPLGGKSYDPEPYPLDALPEGIKNAVVEVQKFSQAPMPMVATCALSSISLAAQAYVNVERDARLINPCSLFSITFADSGERKTTVDGYFVSAIRTFENAQAEAMQPEVDDWKADKQSWAAKKAGILEAIKAAAKKAQPTDELENSLRELEQAEPLEPKVPRLMYGDITPEQLAFSLAKKFPSGGIVSSEAGVIFGSHGMGSDSVMRNLAILNVLWDGGVHTVDRRTTESFAVRNARLTMTLQIQKDVFIEFMRKAGGLARGSGFLARFLVACPESTQGYRPYREPDASMLQLDRFNARITQILSMPMAFDESGDGLAPATLSFDAQAKAVWTKFYNTVESQLKPEGELSVVRDVASKAADNAARIAALFHVYQYGIESQINQADMKAACMVSMWHLAESRRLLSELQQSPELHLAAKLDEWLIEQCNARKVNQIGQVEVLQHAPVRKLRKKAELLPVLQELIDADRVSTATEGRSTMIIVNPKLLNGGAS